MAMRTVLRIVLCCLLFVVGRVWAAEEQPLYTLVETKTYVIVNRFVVTSTSNDPLESVRATVMVGGTDESLHQKKIRYRISPGVSSRITDKLGNIYAVIELGKFAPHEQKTITIEKLVQNSGISFSPDIYKLTPSYTEFLATPENQQYIQPSPHIESDAPEIKADVGKLSTNKTLVERARDIYTGVNVYLQYDTNEAYAHRGALSAQHTRRGVCTEFAGLFVAFCRAVGIPARIVSGYWVPRDTPLNTPVLTKEDRHAWAEFYLPNVGWVPAELSLVTTRVVDGKRLPNYKYFAAIQPNDRHFMWGYGLETEHKPNINIEYRFFSRPNASQVELDAERLTAALVEESVKLVPDETVMAPTANN
jgi:transglutaminase-like putative cysteine protease